MYVYTYVSTSGKSDSHRKMIRIVAVAVLVLSLKFSEINGTPMRRTAGADSTTHPTQGTGTAANSLGKNIADSPGKETATHAPGMGTAADSSGKGTATNTSEMGTAADFPDMGPDAYSPDIDTAAGGMGTAGNSGAAGKGAEGSAENLNSNHNSAESNNARPPAKNVSLGKIGGPLAGFLNVFKAVQALNYIVKQSVKALLLYNPFINFFFKLVQIFLPPIPNG